MSKRHRPRDRAPTVRAASITHAGRRPGAWWHSPGLHVVSTTDRLLLGAVGAVVLAVFAATTSHAVLLEDDGLFLMESATLGVSHPPGYPVHTMLGWIASHVPVGTVAFRVHFLSGVLGALACVVLGWIVARRTGSRVAACCAAAAYGLSEHFWSQAILAEVYTLNALLFFVVLALCVEAAANPRPRVLLAAAIVYGISLANHWPLMILATPALALTLAGQWRTVLARAHLLVPALLAGALIPYAFMVWRSNQDPLIAFYGPLRTWRDVVFYISRRGYAAAEASPTAGWADKLEFVRYVVSQTILALSPAGALLAIAGFVKGWRDGPRVAMLGELLTFLASGVLLALMLGFDYNFLQIAVFRPYPLIAYGLLAVWMGTGVAWMLSALEPRGVLAVRGAAVAVGVIPAVLLLTNYSRNDRSRDDFADRHARMLLQQLDPDAVLFVHGDSDTGPVGYLHFIEGVRPDVTIYNTQGFVFRNRLLPALSSPRRRSERLGVFIASTGKSVYHMTEQVLPPAYGEEHFGFIKRLLPGKPPGAPIARTAETSEQFFRDLVHMPEPRDRWERHTRNQLLHQFGNYLGAAEIGPDAELRERLKPLIESAEGNYFCLNGMVEALTQFGSDRAAWERAVRYLDRAVPLRDETLDPERLGRERYLRGFLAFRLGDRAGAERAFRDSLEIFPGSANASISALAQLRQQKQLR